MKPIYVADAHQYENHPPIDIWVAVCSKQVRSKKDGTAFLALRLGDRSGQCDGVMWENFDECVREFECGDVVKVRARVSRFSGKLQLVIDLLRRAIDGEFEMSDYAPHTTLDIDMLWAQLNAYVDSFTDPHLKALMDSFLTDAEVATALRSAPAAKVMHHAWIGGLLEHIVSLLGICDMAAKHYPEVQRDLLLTGAMLHDIGKLQELRWGMNFEYTLEGQMLGHITLGINMIERRITAIPDFPQHLRLLVEHLVLSHHGRYEYGSPKLPMTPEALLLNFLDDLDAKMHSARAEFVKSEASGKAPDEMTDWVRALERPLLNTQAFLKSHGS